MCIRIHIFTNTYTYIYIYIYILYIYIYILFLDTRGHDLSAREPAHLSSTPPQPARRKGTAHTAGAKKPEIKRTQMNRVSMAEGRSHQCGQHSSSAAANCIVNRVGQGSTQTSGVSFGDVGPPHAFWCLPAELLVGLPGTRRKLPRAMAALVETRQVHKTGSKLCGLHPTGPPLAKINGLYNHIRSHKETEDGRCNPQTGGGRVLD